MAFRFMPVAAAICEASKSGAQSRTICRILTSEIPERYACLFFLPMTRFQPFAWLKEFHVHGIKALGLGIFRPTMRSPAACTGDQNFPGKTACRCVRPDDRKGDLQHGFLLDVPFKKNQRPRAASAAWRPVNRSIDQTFN